MTDNQPHEIAQNDQATAQIADLKAAGHPAIAIATADPGEHCGKPHCTTPASKRVHYAMDTPDHSAVRACEAHIDELVALIVGMFKEAGSGVTVIDAA